MSKWLIPLLLGLTVVCSILFHIILPLHNGIQINTVDAYYMLRYADVCPNIPAHDYFFNYPQGHTPMPQMIFPAMIAITAGLFHIDTTTAGAWVPPILFLLTLIPVYVITRALFKDKLIGVLSVFLLAIMPGEILSRTMIGSADYHCLETFLVATIMMFGILAVRNIRNIRWLVPYSLLGIVFTIIYFMSWQGASLILFIFAIFLLAPFCGRWQTWAIIELVIIELWWFMPLLLNNAISIFALDITATVSEVMPLFFSAGQFDMVTVIGYFSIAFFLTLFGIGVLLHRYVKLRNKELLLFLIWSAVMLTLTFFMRRFAYYSAINIAIITAFISVYIVKLVSNNKVRMIRYIIALVLMICLVFGYRGTVIATSNFGSNLGKMPQDWQECCGWLRTEVADDNYYYTGEDPGYGVFSHWNYGYWIVRAGHMPASGTPGNWVGDDILCKSDITSDIVSHRWRYIVLDEAMFTTNAYPIFYVNNAKPEDTAVYKLFYFGKPVWQSADDKVRVFEAQ